MSHSQMHFASELRRLFGLQNFPTNLFYRLIEHRSGKVIGPAEPVALEEYRIGHGRLE